MIKEKPEDFIVKEIMDLELDESGEYAYYELTKTNLTQEQAFRVICDSLKIKRKFLNFAGTKDKKAITTQHISISKGPKKDFEFENVNLKYLGQGKERISLGQLKGNSFEIVVKTDKKPRNVSFVPNYFDDQRFGMNKNNHIIGKLLIQKKFKEAVELVRETQEVVDEYLQENSSDFIGAIRKLPRKLIQMFVHSYQSYLFNELLKKELMNKEYFEVKYAVGLLFFPKVDSKTKKTLPLIGFGTEITKDIEKVLVDEEISLRDFIMKQIPELSSDGAERNAFVEVKDLKIKEIDEGYVVSFNLPAGSYATIVIKAIFFE
jgi:tRNA pseudouridine13 synthase